MSAFDELLDLSMLYDTARGFLERKSAEDRMQHALLSFVGCCGARFAVVLARDGGDRFAVRGVRGDVEPQAAEVQLGADVERALVEEPGPYRLRDLGAMGDGAAALARRLDAQLGVALVHDGTVRGIALLGATLLGEPHGEREVGLVGSVARLAALALDDGPAPETVVRAAPQRPRLTSADAARKQHPELRRIQGDGPATLALYDDLLAVAPFDFPVLIVGETGTGKELTAQALHELGPRAGQPFEAVNCAAIPRDLIASALFGHEKGAFTGAMTTTRGAFEMAAGGTLFLDEVGDMPLDTQAALLRVLQEQSFRRVGGEKVLPVKARVVSATNVDLLHAVQEQRFRSDLFYRLQMYVIRLRPLRERRDDVPALVAAILRRHAPEGQVPATSQAFLADLAARPLHGNVRELEGLVLGALVRARGAKTLEPLHLPSAAELPPAPPAARPAAAAAAHVEPAPSPETVRSYEDMEREYVRSVLHLARGNKKRAAELMDIPRTTLNARIRKLGLEAS